MADNVWPSSEPPPLRSFNGFGTGFKGFTRADASGRCFATCWLMAVGMPLVPLRRYYVREGATSHWSFGLASTTTTQYSVDGESRLRAIEVIRTYLFCWLVGPAVILVPILALLSRADQITDAFPDQSWVIFAIIGAFCLWLVGSIAALVFFLVAYRARWAPVRDALWVDPPPPTHWQAPLADRRKLRDWDWDDD